MKAGFSLFADVDGRNVGNGGTIPPFVITTSQRPDVVVLNAEERKILILELTCPFDSNINTAHDFKTAKYVPLMNDLTAAGFAADIFCVEVSVRGQITKANRARLKSFLFKSTGIRRGTCVDLICKMSKSALLSSFSIFCARNEDSWQLDRGITL